MLAGIDRRLIEASWLLGTPPAATFLRVTPEEIVITRNTTEANNLVSSGLDLKTGDEVVVWADNHPSNLEAWKLKAERFGYTVKVVAQKEDGKIDLSIKQAQPGYEERPRRQGHDPEFEQKLKRFMSQSQERLVDLKRHQEGKR